MGAHDVYNVQKEVNRRAIFVLCLSVIMALVAAAFISGGVSRQIAELVKGAQWVAKGNLDYKVKVKGADEIARLAHLFNRMSADLRIHIEELKRTTAEKERLIKEIEIARGIQQSFLPDSAPQIKGIDIVAVTVPARMVSGDFYDFIPIEKDKWGIVIADVSGKGVPAALFMALSRTLMRASATVALSPAEAVSHVNTLMMRDSKASMFVTLFYAVVDAGPKVLRYANAGHNPPIFIRGATSNTVFLKAQSAPLGVVSDIGVTTEEIVLKNNDIIVLYTDGVTEAANNRGERFEMERFQRVLLENRHLAADEIIKSIEKEVALFVADQPQFDDITLMVIKAV
jgi:sigma-B regulation protein RsbU (phosphoserine phosphatase)